MTNDRTACLCCGQPCQNKTVTNGDDLRRERLERLFAATTDRPARLSGSSVAAGSNEMHTDIAGAGVADPPAIGEHHAAEPRPSPSRVVEAKKRAADVMRAYDAATDATRFLIGTLPLSRSELGALVDRLWHERLLVVEVQAAMLEELFAVQDELRRTKGGAS